MSTIAADPAEVIHAAVIDLFEGLRALVDRGASDAHPLTRMPWLHLLAAVLLVAGTALHITGVPGLVPVLLIGAAATSAVIQSRIRRARRRIR